MESAESKNCYELLGLRRDASLDEIKEAYRDIARVFHPDSNFFDEIADIPQSNDGSDLFKRVTAAYDTLINPEKRQAYDKMLPKEFRKWESDEDQLRDSQVNWQMVDPGAGRRPRKSTGKFARGKFGFVDTSGRSMVEELHQPHVMPVSKKIKSHNTKNSRSRFYVYIGMAVASFILTVAIIAGS